MKKAKVVVLDRPRLEKQWRMQRQAVAVALNAGQSVTDCQLNGAE